MDPISDDGGDNKMRNKAIDKRIRRYLIVLFSIFLMFAFFGCGNAEQNTDAPAGEIAVQDNPEQAEKVTGSATATPEAISDAIPEAAPENMPEKSQPSETSEKQQDKLTCTVSITCATILDNMGNLAKGKEEVVPADGVIMSPKTVAFEQGDTVFDALASVTKVQKIHMEFTTTPIYKSAYIEGINNIYEFDCGELSGWMYKVNGEFPSRGCSAYELSDGDMVEWIYSCSLGSDIGGNYLEQKGE